MSAVVRVAAGALALVCLLPLFAGSSTESWPALAEVPLGRLACRTETAENGPAFAAPDADASIADNIPVRVAASLPQAVSATEWSRQPRPQIDVVRRLLKTPETAARDPLLRSRDLNPRDVVLSPEAQAGIAAVLASFQEQIEGQARRLDQVVAREFELACERGQAVEVSFSKGCGSTVLQRLGPDPFQLVVAGANLAVAAQHMPESMQLRADRRELGRQLLAELAQAFHAGGALTPMELQGMLDRATAKAAPCTVTRR